MGKYEESLTGKIMKLINEGISQNEIAEELKISRETVSKYKVNPKGTTMEEKEKEANDLYWRILPNANKRYKESCAEVVRLGKIEKGIKTLRINAVELRSCAEKELHHFNEKFEKVTKEYRVLKDEKDQMETMSLKALANKVLQRNHRENSVVENIKIESMEDIAKKMSTEELKKAIYIEEKYKILKEATKKRDTAYNDLREAEIVFTWSKEAYDVAVKSL